MVISQAWWEQAQRLAQEDGLLLTDLHYDVLQLVRSFYQEFSRFPQQRALLHYWRLQYPQAADTLSSTSLHFLFAGQGPRYIAKLAGLPEPDHCL